MYIYTSSQRVLRDGFCIQLHVCEHVDMIAAVFWGSANKLQGSGWRHRQHSYIQDKLWRRASRKPSEEQTPDIELALPFVEDWLCCAVEVAFSDVLLRGIPLWRG